MFRQLERVSNIIMIKILNYWEFLEIARKKIDIKIKETILLISRIIKMIINNFLNKIKQKILTATANQNIR